MATLSNAVSTPTPQCLNDFALLPTSRYKLASMLDQSMAFPANGVNGIVLFGLHGTGKTTMANLLPGLLESSKAHADPENLDPGTLVDTHSPSSQYYACMQGQNGVTLIQGIQSSTGFVAWNASGLHYVILDEVDLLTDAAMTSFKSLMNRKNVVFIMTTNYIEKIDSGIKSRSYLIQMDAAAPADWLPVVQRAIAAYGAVVPPASVLLPLIKGCDGNARDIVSSAVRVAIDVQRRAA